MREEAKKGRMEEGKKGRGEEGKEGRRGAGTKGRGEEGKKGRGEEGKKGRGEEGTRGRGESRQDPCSQARLVTSRAEEGSFLCICVERAEVSVLRLNVGLCVKYCTLLFCA